MIKNYDLEWSLEIAADRGDLEGKKGKLVVDFSDQIGLYVLMKDDKIVYVGMTAKGFWSRLSQHYKTKYRKWDTFSWFGMYPLGAKGLKKMHAKIKPEDLIKDIEAFAIYLTNGKLNVRGGAHKKMIPFKQLPPR
jgi:predicted GIY-YIG superfamily endonuclease